MLTLLRDGSYGKHLETLRARLSCVMNEAILRLMEIGIKLGLKRPACSSGAVSPKASHDIVLASGNAFSISHSASVFLRGVATLLILASKSGCACWPLSQCRQKATSTLTRMQPSSR